MKQMLFSSLEYSLTRTSIVFMNKIEYFNEFENTLLDFTANLYDPANHYEIDDSYGQLHLF